MTKSLIILHVNFKRSNNKHLTTELSNCMTEELSYYLVVLLFPLLTF